MELHERAFISQICFGNVIGFYDFIAPTNNLLVWSITSNLTLTFSYHFLLNLFGIKYRTTYIDKQHFPHVFTLHTVGVFFSADTLGLP